MKKSLWANVLTLAVIAALALPVMGQAGGDPAAGGAGAGGGGRGGRGGRGAAGANGAGGQGRGNFDPAQFLAMRVENLRPQLAPASDDEWKVLSDKLLKVLTLQQQLNAGRQAGGGRGGFGGGGGGGGRGGQPAAADPANPVSVAAVALTTSVADTAAPADGLKTQMAALRDARKKVQGLLTTAQDDLKTVVSVRQEAVLVTQGILE